MTTASPNLSTSDPAARRPTDDIADALAVFLLAAVGLIGFQHAFGGSAYLVIGLGAAFVGLVVVVGLGHLRASPLLWVVGLVVAFFLASGLAVPSEAIAGVIPTPASVSALISNFVTSWVNLATTAPPVGIQAGLGVVPYVCGFVAGAGGMLIARQTRLTLLPAAPAGVVLVAGLLFGTAEPVAVLTQGLGFVVVALGWGAVRSNRARRGGDDGVYWPRIAASAVMLAMVALVAIPLASRLPLLDTGDRFVLREHTEPPFDPRNEPSPLAAYRNYVQKAVKDDPVVAVDGLPTGSRVRLATMDTYDGVVWIVGGPTAPSSGRFERVGTAIDPVPAGERATVTLRSEVDRKDVWLPTVGATESVAFAGADSEALSESFRYNRDTGTGALPDRLDAGDAYALDVVVPVVRDDAVLATARVDSTERLPTISEMPEFLAKRASEITVSASTPYDQAKALEAKLREGFYSDGNKDDPGGDVPSPAGHSVARLSQLLNPDEVMVGNAEQYAAAMAIMARSIGLPARVVMGFKPAEDVGAGGEVVLVNKDVDAWVEIPFEGVGWVAFDPTPAKDRTPEEKPLEKPQEEDLSQQEPPPPTYLEPPDASPQLAAAPPEVSADDGGLLGFKIPGFVLLGLAIVALPILAIALVVGLIAGLKAWRRKRRRTRGTPVQRLDGAWREACDRATDVGARFPRRATRREAAAAVDVTTWAGATLFADEVDAAMFGSDEPDAELAERVWGTVDQERTSMVATLDRRQKLKASANLRSLRSRR